jgi:hypothetical protein
MAARGAFLCFVFLPMLVVAQSNTVGFIYGHVRLENTQPASEALVTITNAQTGLQRAVATREDGSYRFPALPIGTYSILIEANGYIAAEHAEITVSVGTGTNANVTLVQGQEETLELGILTVVGSKISPVDVSSTESTTILSMETIELLAGRWESVEFTGT